MNCLEFRRLKLADPRRLTGAARTHANACAGCFAFAQRVDESEALLERALMVPVPEGLADRLLLRQTDAIRPRRRVFALAAGVVFAVAAGAIVRTITPSNDAARLAIEHVLNEPESLTTFRNAESPLFHSIVHAFGGEIKEPLGRVRYVKLCPVEKGTGWHIVLETPQGLATLILVPDQHITAPESATVAGWSARAEPTRRGYYAVVTGSEGTTSLVHRLIEERIQWNT